MRVAMIAALLWGGALALGQSSAPGAANPGKLALPPQAGMQAARDFARPPAEWHFTGTAPVGTVTVVEPHAAAPRRWNDARIDPRMIVHPPPSSLGVQPKGTFLAQNLYPGLEFLPIGISKAKLEPIPIAWPNLKVEPIPTLSPNLRATPVQSGAERK